MKPRRLQLAFTLIELMISIAIVLILILGINFVFSTTSRTIGLGTALTGVGREIRGARKVFEADFANAVPAEEMPALIIHNEAINAWRDKQDKLNDYDTNPGTYDADGEQGNGDEIILQQPDPALWGTANLPGVYNFRRHRIDRISWFMRSSSSEYRRQTGDHTTYVGPETSPEAWVSYGLLRIAANDGFTYWKPGARGSGPPFQDEAANHNNFFASQWMLGRRMIVLKDPATFATGPTAPAVYAYADPAGAPPLYCGSTVRSSANITQTFDVRRQPYPTGAQPWKIEESRVDLAAGKISDIRLALMAATASTWSADADDGAAAQFRNYSYSPGTPDKLNYLSWAKPFLDKTTFSADLAAQTQETALTTPIYLAGCTQFIVEFAGDFYDQGGTAVEPLGTIDYVEVPAPGSGETKIRWYGMARDTDGTATIDLNMRADTLPLTVPPFARGSNTAAAARFNTAVQQPRSGTGKPFIWAWGPMDPLNNPKQPATGTATATDQGNGNNVRPSLIRITIELIDPNGRLPDGQRIELIYPIKTPVL